MAATLDARIRLDSSQFSGGLNRALRETNAAVGKMSAQFGTLRNVLGGGAVGFFAAGFTKSLFDATVQAEKLQASLSATMGSDVLGKAQLEKVRTLAGDIGLDVNQAAKAMIQFKSAGMDTADAMEVIKAGYNAILSTGGGAAEFSRFAVAIQQMRTSPKPLQEEINQLREALPATAKLLQDAFGAQRSEDLQKLGITGKQAVEGILEQLQKMPAIGDTLEKQVGRLSAKWQQFKGQLGEATVGPGTFIMDELTRAMDWWKRDQAQLKDFFTRVFGGDPELMRKWEDQDVAAEEARAKAAEDAKKEADETTRSLDAKAKSIEHGKTLLTVFGKFNDIIKATAQSSRELAASLDFADRMRAFTDQEARNDFEASLDRTRAELDQAIMDKRQREAEMRGEAFNDFAGPQQMGDDERNDWQERVRREGMTRSDRKSARDADREERENIRKAADRKTREQMREIKEEERKKAFDNAKQGKFFDEEATKKNLRDLNRKSAEEAVKGAAKTLTDIRDILKTLATA